LKPKRDSHPVPERMRRALAAIFEEPVDDVDISVQPLYVRLHGRRVRATTRPNRICLGCGVEAFLEDPELVLHEYYHVLRQWNPGVLNRYRYLLECRRNGYVLNKYEVEARAFARENLQRFKSLLRADPRIQADVNRTESE
jgi:hypothetical protein